MIYIMNYLNLIFDCVKLYYVPYWFILEKTITKKNISYIKNIRYKNIKVIKSKLL